MQGAAVDCITAATGNRSRTCGGKCPFSCAFSRVFFHAKIMFGARVSRYSASRLCVALRSRSVARTPSRWRTQATRGRGASRTTSQRRMTRRRTYIGGCDANSLPTLRATPSSKLPGTALNLTASACCLSLSFFLCVFFEFWLCCMAACFFLGAARKHLHDDCP